MVDLTALECQAAEPVLIRKGSILRPNGLGVDQQLNRLGDRFAIAFTAPAKHVEPNGRQWIADLQLAQQRGARVLYPQVDFSVGTPGSPTVDGAVAGGMTLPITGCTPHYSVRKGQALSLTKGDRSYLYFAAVQVILDASGEGTIPLTVMLRTMLAGGEPVNLAAPVIEGFLDGDERSWTLEASRTVGLSFTIRERA